MTVSTRSGVLLGAALAAVLVEPRVAVRLPSAIDSTSLIDSGRYHEAEQMARRRLDERRRRYGERSNEAVEASNLWLRARLLNGRGGSAESISAAEALVRFQEEALGREHSALAPALQTLGRVLVEAAQPARGIEVCRRALTLVEHGGDSLDVASLLDDLGTALTADGQHDEALAVLDRSLRIKERLLDPSDVGIARTLEVITLASQRKGAYPAARLAIARAAAIQEAAAPNHPNHVGTLNLLAQQFWFDNDLPRSRDASARAVGLAEVTLRPDHPMRAKSLRYLAGTVFELGDLQRAHSLWKLAFEIAERNFGSGHIETALYLHDVALSELELGQYVAARANFEKARGIFEESLGPWHDHLAHTLHNAAIVDAKLGDMAEARRKQARAITIWTRTSGATHPYVAEALTELARVLLEEGASAEAQPLLERALKIREEGLGPQHRDVALTLAELANVLASSGQQARAQRLATRALGIWERISTPDAPEQAAVMALYAELQAGRAQYDVAREYYERASAIQRRVFGSSSPSYAASQAGLANVLATLGEDSAALVTAVNAEATGRDHLRLMLRSLPERQALAYARSRPRALDLVLSLATRSDEAAGPALDSTIRGRALVLDEVAARRRAVVAPDDVPVSLRADFDSAQQRLANLMVRGPGNLPSAAYTGLLEEARRQSERAEQVLAERSVAFRAERSRAQLGLDAVAGGLPPGAVLVSFVRYERSQAPRPASPEAGSRARSVPAVPSYLAFVVRAGRPPVVAPLGSAALIDAAVYRWRGHVAGALPSRASGAALRRLVWEPIAAHLSGAERLFIVTDGSLSLVPFAALPVGLHAWLIEEAPVIHYLTAERDLVPEERETRGETRTLLAVGGPAFDGATRGGTGPAHVPSRTSATAPDSGAPGTLRGAGIPCADLQSVRFQPLTGTLREVEELSSLWSHPAPVAVGQAQMLTGRDATETRLKQEAPRHRVLHLATHGFFLGDCVPAPGIGTRGVGGLATSLGQRSSGNPLLLSGLVFAGANRRASAAPDEDDGILTAEEVASLNLSGVEWAVLSACDTGVGEIKAGEGVFGLRRAFQVAGARTVIMSLWSVEDQATRAWMRALYEERFQKGATTADAVHAASLAVLRDRRAKGQSTHPFFWAAFVAAGDWR